MAIATRVVLIIILCILFIYPGCADGWNAEINALHHLEPVTIGYSTQATDGYDHLMDEYALKPDDTRVVISLDQYFSKSLKKESLTWSLTVNNRRHDYSWISWNVSGTPENLILVEKGNPLVCIDMKKFGAIQIAPGWYEYTIYANDEAIEYLTKISATITPGSTNSPKYFSTATIQNIESNSPSSNLSIQDTNTTTPELTTTVTTSSSIDIESRQTLTDEAQELISTSIPLGLISVIGALFIIGHSIRNK